MEDNKISASISEPFSDNVKKLAELFPSVVKDGEVDFDALKAELGEFTEVGKESYSLNWAGKVAAQKKTGESLIGKTLKFDPSESKNPDTTENLYIEGDNLEVLKLLQNSYRGKVKLIYIDPPYNTGNDFIYNDNFHQTQSEIDSEEGRISEEGERFQVNLKTSAKYHAKWLSMMYPRLKLARNLLAENGVIIISIDDNEMANLKKICDEIFGYENFAATFLWTKTSTPPALSYKNRKTVEYVLAYEKSLSTMKYYGSPLDGGDAPLLNSGNPIKTLEFPPKSIHFTYLENGYVTAGIKEKVEILDKIVVRDGLNENVCRISGEFKWEQATLNTELANGSYIICKSDKCSLRFQRINTGDSYKTPTNDLNLELNKESGVGTNESAAKELVDLGLESCFDYAKPTSLLEKIIAMVCKFDKDAIILDFFSGSASTAHAVLKTNAKDGGSRKYILVQLPETIDDSEFDTIAEIGKERIRRAGAIIEKDHPDVDTGFKVFKVADTNIRWIAAECGAPGVTLEDALTASSKDLRDFMPGSNDLDVVYEILIRQYDIPLTAKIENLKTIGKRTYSIADTIIVCLEENVTDAIIDKIAAIEPIPQKIVFRDSAFNDDISLKENAMMRLDALMQKHVSGGKQPYSVEFL